MPDIPQDTGKATRSSSRPPISPTAWTSRANPYSEQVTIDERFSLEDVNGTKVLTYQATITDPVYYTEPIKIERRYQPYDGFIIPYGCQDELWYELLELRREQLEAGKPVEARMSDVYKIREERE